MGENATTTSTRRFSKNKTGAAEEESPKPGREFTLLEMLLLQKLLASFWPV